MAKVFRPFSSMLIKQCRVQLCVHVYTPNTCDQRARIRFAFPSKSISCLDFYSCVFLSLSRHKLWQKRSCCIAPFHPHEMSDNYYHLQSSHQKINSYFLRVFRAKYQFLLWTRVNDISKRLRVLLLQANVCTKYKLTLKWFSCDRWVFGTDRYFGGVFIFIFGEKKWLWNYWDGSVWWPPPFLQTRALFSVGPARPFKDGRVCPRRWLGDSSWLTAFSRVA